MPKKSVKNAAVMLPICGTNFISRTYTTNMPRKGRKPAAPKVTLPGGKSVSPESAFIRTGIMQPGFNLGRAERLGSRYIAKKWGEVARQRKPEHEFYRLLLPTLKERRFGARLSRTERSEIRRQAKFGVTRFGMHLSAPEKQKLFVELMRSFSKRSQTVKDNLRSYVRHGDKGARKIAKRMRKGGVDLLSKYVTEKGNVGGGTIDERTVRISIAKGFMKNPYYAVTPIHETIHWLQQRGIIKIDVPFSEAIDTFYYLQMHDMPTIHMPQQKGVGKANVPFSGELDALYSFQQHNLSASGRKPISANDFERKPRKLGTYKGIPSYEEPAWAYETGQALGNWAHQNLSGKQGWQYFFLRCMGETHPESVNIVRGGDFEKVIKKFRPE